MTIMDDMDWIAFAGNVLLFLLVFNMSATVDINCMKVQIQNKKAILAGLISQFIILPLLGFGMVKIMSNRIPYTVGIMLLVVTSSPGGSYSNWWCSMFNADLALSVTMTAISTILSIGVLPLNLLLYTKLTYDSDVLDKLDWTSLFVALTIVITAICSGLYCSYQFQNRLFNKIANQCGNIAGFTLIVFSATMSNSGADDDGTHSRIWSHDWTFYTVIAIPCILGVIVTTAVTTYYNLAKPERVTVAIEGCYQNVGIATSLALTMFDGVELNEAIGVPFFYGVVEAIVVGIFCVIAWKIGWTKAPINAPIWTVIMTSYEVLEAESKDLHTIEVEAVMKHTNSSIEASDTTTTERSILSEIMSEDGGIFTTYFDFSYVTNEILNPKPDPPPRFRPDPPAPRSCDL